MNRVLDFVVSEAVHFDFLFVCSLCYCAFCEFGFPVAELLLTKGRETEMISISDSLSRVCFISSAFASFNLRLNNVDVYTLSVALLLLLVIVVFNY